MRATGSPSWSTFRHHLIDTAIWHKGAGLPAAARNVLNSRFEYLLLFSPQENPSRAVPTADFRGTVSNVYAGPPQRHNRYAHLHRTTFPLHLPLWLMETFDAAGGTVYDPFLGTGTTLLAAEDLGRFCLGMEIEPCYCDLILARWEKATGGVAHRQ